MIRLSDFKLTGALPLLSFDDRGGGFFVVRRLWGEIDLHVAVMLLMLAPAAWLGWWGLVVPFLVPQVRIVTRAFVDYSAFKRRPWAYLAANEVLVFGVICFLAGLRFVVASVA